MIHFSFSSVLMTIVVSNLLLAAITLLFRNEDVLAGIGFKLTAVFCVITLVRFLFPFELPFAKTIIFPRFLSLGLSALRHRYNILPGFRLSVWDIFCIVWLVESIRRLIILLYNQQKANTLIRTNSKDVTNNEPYVSLLTELCTKRQRKRIRLRTSLFVNAPMIMGLRNPIILLPADVDTSDEEVMFSLRHEIYHYVHHDLWLKFAINCLAVAYWWNPCTRLLRKQVGILLEMRVDDSIISEGHAATVGYISCMVHYMESDLKKDSISSQYTGFALKKTSNMSRRLRMIQSKGEQRNYALSIVMSLAIIGMYVSSYLFILENSSYRQEITESDVFAVPSDKDLFAIQNEDGTYTIYFPSWGYNETTQSLENYPKIKVYSSKDEYDASNQNP